MVFHFNYNYNTIIIGFKNLECLLHATMLLLYTHIWYKNEFDQNMLPVLLLRVGNERIAQPNMLRQTDIL